MEAKCDKSPKRQMFFKSIYGDEKTKVPRNRKIFIFGINTGRPDVTQVVQDALKLETELASTH